MERLNTRTVKDVPLYQLYYTLSPGEMQPTGPYYRDRKVLPPSWLPASLGPFEMRRVKVTTKDRA